MIDPIAALTKTYKDLVRNCWRPKLISDVAEFPEGALPMSRYGGFEALFAPGSSWPLHDDEEHGDGGAMSLVIQLDTDTLPEGMQEKFGGPNQVFQLFVPTGQGDDDARQWTFDDDDDMIHFFDVRILSKTQDLQTRRQPAFPEHFDVPPIPVSYIVGWEQEPDVPFQHGGPYPEGFEPAHDAWDDLFASIDETHGDEGIRTLLRLPEGAEINSEGANVWGDKIGGWPSLEQGPQYWDDEDGDTDELWDHMLQIDGTSGDTPTGYEVAPDGHGWLGRTPDGQWFFYTVTS